MREKTLRIPKDEAREVAGRFVEVLVGDEQEPFSVHENLVRASSSFFDRAMTGEWMESSERIIRLPNEEPRIFGIYLHWLYYGTLPVYSDEPGPPADTEYLELVKAYVLGDILLDFKFQDTAIDAIVDKSRTKAEDGVEQYPDCAAIVYAYRNTHESAPIRELLLDMYATFAYGSWLRDYKGPPNVPQPFVLELAARLLDRKSHSGGSLKAKKYHRLGSDGKESPDYASSLENDMI